jgi:3-oxoacyl-[acyl-carrier-protein] synthase II
MRMIQYGTVDMMVAGGAEMATSPTGLGGFAAARALSTRNDDPQGASRPWDRDRDGFVLSDGAGVLVLEEVEHAKARGADLRRAGRFGDELRRLPHDLAVARTAKALRRLHAACAGRCRDQPRRGQLHQCPRHLDAGRRRRRDHGGQALPSATMPGVAGQFDQVDDRAHAGRRRRRRGDVHGTRDPRPGRCRRPSISKTRTTSCDLDYVPNTAREARVDVALSNSFGFGGTNGTLVFRRLGAIRQAAQTSGWPDTE